MCRKEETVLLAWELTGQPSGQVPSRGPHTCSQPRQADALTLCWAPREAFTPSSGKVPEATELKNSPELRNTAEGFRADWMKQIKGPET